MKQENIFVHVKRQVLEDIYQHLIDFPRLLLIVITKEITIENYLRSNMNEILWLDGSKDKLKITTL